MQEKLKQAVAEGKISLYQGAIWWILAASKEELAEYGADFPVVLKKVMDCLEAV